MFKQGRHLRVLKANHQGEIVANRTNGYVVMSSALLAALWMSVLHSENVVRPDLNGLWTPARGPSGERPALRFPSDPPYTELGRRLWDAYTTEFDPVVDDPARFCVHPGMPGSMIGTPTFPMEIFHREHDVTMMLEAYYQYRKIYLDGYDRPEPILTTRMGYSVGRWDGDTLVVETSHLSERNMGRILMSEAARIVERIRVEVDEDGNRLLVVDITFTDPEIYSEPIAMRGYWNSSPDTPIMEYVCSQNIFDEYIANKRAQAADAEN
jgi:hypothetical protein